MLLRSLIYSDPLSSPMPLHLRALFGLFSLFLLALSVACKFVQGAQGQVLRNSVADIFFVGAVYFAMRVLLQRNGSRATAIFVFLLASLVELLQLAGISKMSWIPRELVFWIGDVFDPGDILMYGIGIIVALAVERCVCQIMKSSRGLANKL